MADILSCARYLLKHYGSTTSHELNLLLLTCDGYHAAWYENPLFFDQPVVGQARNDIYDYLVPSYPAIDCIFERRVLLDKDAIFMNYDDIPVVSGQSLTDRERFTMDFIIRTIRDKRRTDILHIVESHKSFKSLRVGDTIGKYQVYCIFKSGLLDIDELKKYDAADIAQWFYNKSAEYDNNISHGKIDVLLFCAYGISLVNETIDKLFDNKITMCPLPVVDRENIFMVDDDLLIDINTEFLLECVWRSFGQYASWKLFDMIYSEIHNYDKIEFPCCIDDELCRERFKNIHFKFILDNCV